jgi:hypothetical protein
MFNALRERVFSFEITSCLAAEKDAVLAHAARMAGVNHELGPLLRMTAPRSYRQKTLFDAPVGRPVFRSYLLLGRVLPIDFDHLSFESIDRGSGFVESSTMLSMRSWRHERRVTCDDGDARRGSRLVDRLSFTPRIPGTGILLAWIVKMLFRHRHARLRALFGAT